MSGQTVRTTAECQTGVRAWLGRLEEVYWALKAWAVLRKLKKEEDDFLGRERGCEQGVKAEVLETHSGDPRGHTEEQGSSVSVCPQSGVSLVSD